jgi:hypothetical protein
LYEELDDGAFAELCEKLGGHKIFEIVSSIDDQAGEFLDTFFRAVGSVFAAPAQMFNPEFWKSGHMIYRSFSGHLSPT